MNAVLATAEGVNAALLRPFRERVDLLNVILVLALLLTIAGMWHMVLQRVEL